MTKIENTGTVSASIESRLTDAITEAFDAGKLDPTYGPSIYVAWAILNSMSFRAVEDLVAQVICDSDNGEIQWLYFGNYADETRETLIANLVDSKLNIDDMQIANGIVFSV